MSFGEVIDASFRLYRRTFQRLVLVQAIISVPVAVISAFLINAPNSGDTASTLAGLGSSAPWAVLTALLAVIQFGAVITVADRSFRGLSPTPGEAYAQALRRLPELIGYAVLAGLAVFIGALLVVIPGIIAFVLLSQGLFAVVLERAGVMEAMRRSYYLVSGFPWRVLSVALVAILVVSAIELAVTSLAAACLPGIVASAITQCLCSVVFGPVAPVALYMQYTDLRQRKDGLAADD